MVNRQRRDPGGYREFSGSASINGVPEFAVGGGEAARALASVAGSLSARLKTLADRAAAREGELAGLSAGERGAAGYLQARAAENGTPTKIGGRPSRAQVNAPAEIRNIIVAAAQKYGEDPAAALKIAELESAFNPAARNPRSTAGGLFQFLDGTARDYGLVDKFDPAQSADAGVRLLRDNRTHLRQVLGREPSIGELYLAHQQGRGGASKILGNPDARAADLVGSDAVRLNGGNPDMSARDFAGLWLAKAGDVPGAISRKLPALSSQPLALRGEGTISGDAFNDAARRAYAWRVEQGLATDLASAAQDFKDDPAGLNQRIDEIRGHYLSDGTFSDPELRESFEKTFASRTHGLRLQAAAVQEQRLAAEQKSAVDEGLSARTIEIERQAYALGANPEGDKILKDELARSSRSIDAAVKSGMLTPAQGSDRKSKLAETAARARVQGVFDNLDTPAQKEQFALSLLEDWQSGEGPLAEMPFSNVRALSQTLYRDARAAANANDSASRIEKARIKTLLADDVASIEATGKPLDLEEAGTSLEDIQAAMTPAELAAWQSSRDQAGRLFDAVSGLETLPAGEIEKRLTGLVPEPGQAGYADAVEVYETAEKKAAEVVKLRAKDPALAVEKAFQQVAEVADAVDLERPETLKALVDARLQAQDALDLPAFSRRPLTLSEATSLATAVLRAGDGRAQAEAMQQLVEQVQGTYGAHANAVLSQVLEVQGVDKQMSQYGAALFSRMNRGGPPTAADRRQGGVLSETAEAERSGQGTQDLPAPPPYRAIQMLIEQPNLAAQFDEKYGAGSADQILGDRREDPYRRRVEGGVEFVDETGEGFIPDD